ncbi:MAG TPA: hypothetical protein VI524_15075, partial [Anaerolineales bacterium]|nr:hypothetical protein [Anaerolineales bacterium]
GVLPEAISRWQKNLLNGLISRKRRLLRREMRPPRNDMREVNNLRSLSIRVHTGVGNTDGQASPWRRGDTFWRRLGWDNDLTVFSIYWSVPGAPELQRVWDAYQE